MRPLFIILSCFLLTQCARQSQPGGGPKDIDAPELLVSTPKNGEKNFHGKIVQLTFDEFIKLKDPKEEIVITPSFGPNTKFVAKKNRVSIYPEFNLQDTTTYSIAFRDGIQDLNESNPADDLHLAFSTGSTIDSMKLSGSVAELFNEKVPTKITIALFQSDTFNIFKHRPVLFTKGDKTGKFLISNLKPGNYYVYAFDDKNKNQKVDSQSERFGFLANSISLPQQKDSLHLNLIHLDARQIKLTTIRNSSSISIIRFNKAIDSIKLSAEKSIIYTYGDTRSEIIVYKDFDKQDSVKINIHATDSIQQKLDTTVYVKYSENKYPEDKFKMTDWVTTYDATTNSLTAATTTNKLLSAVTYDSIYIQIDTINFQSITPKDIIYDTLRKKFTIKTQLHTDPKSPATNPILLIGNGALITIDGDSSKSRDLKIKIPKPEETGTVVIELNTQEKHFQVLLTTPDNKPIQSFKDQKKYTFSHLIPGEYKITIIIDTNNNGRWDPGSFYKREEPEKVKQYKTLENKASFPIRANWELGPLVIEF